MNELGDSSMRYIKYILCFLPFVIVIIIILCLEVKFHW